MRISVLSGKGGAGKTLVSVNLAAVAERATLLDCDVEEPNARLYLKPGQPKEETVFVNIPAVDQARCTGCRKCVEFCRFNAMAYTKGRLLIFEDVCHACGGCVMLCPEKALKEKRRPVGIVESGVSGGIHISTGILNTGEASGMPVIKRLLRETPEDGRPVFIDCPPGSGCTVMECVRSSDYCILVAEPTTFGAHDLEMAYDTVRLLGKAHGAVLNKCMDMEYPSEKFCQDHGIHILGRIAFDRELAEMNADGRIPANENEKYRGLFSGLLKTILKEASHETAADTER